MTGIRGSGAMPAPGDLTARQDWLLRKAQRDKEAAQARIDAKAAAELAEEMANDAEDPDAVVDLTGSFSDVYNESITAPVAAGDIKNRMSPRGQRLSNR
jgi:hypothetical protein